MATMSAQKRPSFRAEPALERLIEELMVEHGIEKQSDYLRGLIILDKVRKEGSLEKIGIRVSIPAWVVHEFSTYFSIAPKTKVQPETSKL